MSSRTKGPKPLIAVCQVTSTPDREHNWAACSQLVREATQRDACVVFLPEAFDFIGSCTEETLSLAEPLEGDYLQRYVSLARWDTQGSRIASQRICILTGAYMQLRGIIKTVPEQVSLV